MNRLFPLIVCSAAMWASTAQASSNFAVNPGNWVITSEVNGQPGRGMGIEVREGVLVMTVYNYKASGDATFHLASGSMVDNSFTGQLVAYRGGRYLGSSARDAVSDGLAGQVNVYFSSANTGTIQFPGEQPLAISHFMFDGVTPGRFSRVGVDEYWFVTELDAANQPVSSSTFGTNQDAAGVLYTTSSLDVCTVESQSGMARCSIVWNAAKDEAAVIEMKHVDRQLEGSITKSSSPGTKNRLIATRTHTVFVASNSQVFDAPKDSDTAIGVFKPEAGMWIVTSENTGKPGRGLNIETQLDTLVLQLYGYQSDGSATFHIGAAPIAKGESVVPLNKVRGGRYFGSGALVGSNSGNDGSAQVQFSSTVKGRIRFPGEGWVDMQKLPFGGGPLALESLMGTWSVLATTSSGTRVSSKWKITQLNNSVGTASGDGLVCRYEVTPHGSVRCTESFTISGRGTVYSADYRFTPAYGAGVATGYSMQITSQGQIDPSNPNRIILQRVTDSRGVTAGVKSEPIEEED